jgi:hypothetical protein
VQIARGALLDKVTRKSKYETGVVVYDYFTPTLYTAKRIGRVNLLVLKLLELSTQMFWTKTKLSSDAKTILRLETALAAGCNTVIVQGTYGCGRTTLANHVTWWWTVSGFVSEYVYIDCTTLAQYTYGELQIEVDLRSDNNDTGGDIPHTPRRRLIALDSLHSSYFPINTDPNQELRKIKRFVKSLKYDLILLQSRTYDTSIDSAASSIYTIANLMTESGVVLVLVFAPT